MTSDCLTIVTAGGTVSVARLGDDVELWHRTGDVFADEHGSWRVDDVRHDERCLVIVEVGVDVAFSLPELLAA